MSLFEEESPFDWSELFFSRTDIYGNILSGNSVFKRVSEYEWSDLISKPHNLIRHPDMPRGVFFLLWHLLKQNLTVGAFVKNRSRTGKYYWVFALVFPVSEGFLSIRLKPSGNLFSAAQKIYSEHLQKEKSQRLSPEASFKELAKVIEGAGFSGYQEFMVAALKECLEERQSKLNLPPLAQLSRLTELNQTSAQFLEKSSEISASYKQATLIPLNMEIRTQLLGDQGSALSAVAGQFDRMAREIEVTMTRFQEQGSRAKQAVARSQLLVSSALLQEEMWRFFEGESKSDTENAQVEMGYLRSLVQQGVQASRQELMKLELEFDDLQRSCNDLNRLSNGLEIVRLTGKIEVARLNTQTDLTVMMNALAAFRTSLSSAVSEIDYLSKKLMSITKSLSQSTNLSI